MLSSELGIYQMVLSWPADYAASIIHYLLFNFRDKCYFQ